MKTGFRRTSLIITVSQLINYAFPLLTFPLLVKTFDATLYGVWIEASTLVSLVSAFSSTGLGNALAAVVVDKDSQTAAELYSDALMAMAGLGGLLAVVMAVAAPILNNLTIRAALGVSIIQTVAPLTLTLAVNWLCTQVFRTRQQPLRGAVFDVLLSIGKLLCVIYAVISHDLLAFAQLYVVTQILLSGAQVVVAYQGIVLSRPRWLNIRRLVRYGANLSIVGQANWLVSFGDRLMLSIFSTSTAVAVYAASYQLTLVLVALGSPYLYALLPLLGERWRQNDIPGAQAAIRQSTRAILILLIPAVAGLALTGDSLLRILATDRFAQGGLLIGLIALGVALDVLGTNLQYIFYVQNRPQVLRNIYVSAALFNILANVVAIPILGLYGAGLTTLLTFLLIIGWLWRQTNMPISSLIEISVLGRCLLACLLMAGWVGLTIKPTLPDLALSVAGGAILYGSGLLILRVITIPKRLRFRENYNSSAGPAD